MIGAVFVEEEEVVAVRLRGVVVGFVRSVDAAVVPGFVPGAPTTRQLAFAHSAARSRKTVSLVGGREFSTNNTRRRTV